MKVPFWLLTARTRKKNARGISIQFSKLAIEVEWTWKRLTIGSGSELAGVIKEEAQNQVAR